jgi:hypothetical protein
MQFENITGLKRLRECAKVAKDISELLIFQWTYISYLLVTILTIQEKNRLVKI